MLTLPDGGGGRGWPNEKIRSVAARQTSERKPRMDRPTNQSLFAACINLHSPSATDRGLYFSTIGSTEASERVREYWWHSQSVGRCKLECDFAAVRWIEQISNVRPAAACCFMIAHLPRAQRAQ